MSLPSFESHRSSSIASALCSHASFIEASVFSGASAEAPRCAMISTADRLLCGNNNDNSNATPARCIHEIMPRTSYEMETAGNLSCHLQIFRCARLERDFQDARDKSFRPNTILA